MSSTNNIAINESNESRPPVLEKKPVKFSNLLLGAGLNLFEVGLIQL